MMTRDRDQKMSKEEIRDLFKEYKKTKDKDIRNQLIEEHLYIAEILSKKYVNRGIEYDDLYQVACLGLIYAIDRYDVDKGYEFSSFATPTIIGEIKKHFRDKGWTIRVPRRIQEMSKKVNLAKTSLTQTLKRNPTVKDIAEYLGVSEEEVIESLEASKVYTTKSLDQTYDNSEDKDSNLGDMIGMEDKNFDSVELKDFIDGVLEKLNAMEKKILVYRYYEKRTQVSIAEELNISQMTVSRIEKKIIEKFKREYRELN